MSLKACKAESWEIQTRLDSWDSEASSRCLRDPRQSKQRRDTLTSRTNNELNLLVTHQVIITAVTGEAPPSGGIVIYNSDTGASKLISLH